MKKPNKILYENQDSIFDLILDKLKKDLPSESEAYLFGSLAERKFGVYCEVYNGHQGSDIDVIVFCKKIPENWKYLNVSKGWWDLYRGLKIKIKDCIHKVDILLVKEGFEDTARERIKEWKTIRIK